MDSNTLSLKHLQSQIGNKAIGEPELIELNMIKEWAKAVAWPDPPNPLYTDEVFAKKTRYKGGFLKKFYCNSLAEKYNYH